MQTLTNQILPGQTIGIVGGGQLGQMMTLAAKEMGFAVIILDPQADCPAGQVADDQIVAAYDDQAQIMMLAQRVDVLTYEFENVDAKTIEAAREYTWIPQGTKALRIAQDRLLEKQFLVDQQLPHATFEIVTAPAELIPAVKKVGFPCILKTTRSGYDGKGQVILRSAMDMEVAQQLLTASVCVLEAMVHFDQEISVIISQNSAGQQAVFPAIENQHRDNILHISICPARISAALAAQAESVAAKIATQIELVGTLGVEFFVGHDGQLYVNEIAPRPHNSGHLTIEACDFSQFATHIRGVCNWPLQQPRLWQSAIVVNVLGQHWQVALDASRQSAVWHYHDYGKDVQKTNRKMGHVTVLTNTVEETLVALKATKIWD
ncbi:5-(carboxyamino)imidazole ribonucleotide synthase [Latilactobacillus curvatus]|uniref:5-(carboxyamino)imidazole ribonucleotide synthase n=1 Tax=Latilactobacillus curvatus TaxID=28038 RepID=UPI0009D69CC8|nr:5-(carboxyamino)imidazole ribonucleotide synthase [Latilactobacillus curvatus]UTB70168.1 5-(carboxyamino)imidazole ribonucleotide synthase [Latilactobacillus curvatus]UTB74584.1 5-(carboxyamino)imidazole ribonucleotide synthase [Latilactobacillus curvatus]UTY80391.1 5-(carboxyamino)imidazole ribonucleotide synthase [Latilactobacillus curvatus]